MKTYRPAIRRGFCSFAAALFWTPVIIGLWVLFLQIILFINRLESPRSGMSPAGQHLLLVLSVIPMAVSGAMIALTGLLAPSRARYEVRATEIVVHSGVLWRSTRTAPILDIERIELSSGPLMRILGLQDVKVYCWSADVFARPVNGRSLTMIPLYGMPDAEEVKALLLERRESLKEAALRGEHSVAKTPDELLLSRLASAVEQLEQRLPSSRA